MTIGGQEKGSEGLGEWRVWEGKRRAEDVEGRVNGWRRK